ncbi:MAG: hypothetical protein ACYTG1_04775 [Planctomycetota bacterium]
MPQQQVKFFKGVESEATKLETEVNEWLVSSGAHVIQISGNIAPQTVASGKAAPAGRSYTPSDLFVAILYETP